MAGKTAVSVPGGGRPDRCRDVHDDVGLRSHQDPGDSAHRKHRADNETRTISIPPELVKLLRAHIKKYGTTPDGRIFQTTLGGIIQDSAYSAVWAEARKTALTEAQFRSPLGRRPCPSVDPAASGPERTDT